VIRGRRVNGLSRSLRENWLTVAVIGALAAGFLFLRSSETNLASVQEFEALIRNGRGSVVYFFSNT
jgi:hypothetical protein